MSIATIQPPPADHPAVLPRRIGVLLLNLGTPDSYDTPSMRRYLEQFLTDPRVIELPRWKWWPILYGIVLNTRPKKSGAAYAKIWDHERGDSPLRLITRSQTERLVAALGDLGDRVVVDFAMRYGNPSTPDRIRALIALGCDRLLLVPLYPQYAGATTATANDEAFRALIAARWQPAVRTIPAYHDEPAYIEALATSLRRHLAGLDWEPDAVLASFHGMPKRYLLSGDPYHCQCIKTARLLREAMGWPADRLRVSFQSRFGREEWLKPYTDETIEALPGEGVKRLAVITPGFSADCLETLEEIAMEGASAFLEAGGEKFTHVPCLNDAPEHVAMLETLVRRELSGWV